MRGNKMRKIIALLTLTLTITISATPTKGNLAIIGQFELQFFVSQYTCNDLATGFSVTSIERR